MTPAATYRPPTKTFLTFEQAAGALRLALAAVSGADPAAPVLALALAKTALETGRWTAMWNGNWGNVKCSDTYVGEYTCITLNEVIDGTVRWFAPAGELVANPVHGEVLIGPPLEVPPGHPQTRMRAFDDPAAGALDYLKFVAGGRYRAAWARLLAGDAPGYVHELKQAKYFTADEGRYAAGVVALQREFTLSLTTPGRVALFEVPPPSVVREWLSSTDIAQLEAELADWYFDLLTDHTDRNAEMQGGDP